MTKRLIALAIAVIIFFVWSMVVVFFPTPRQYPPKLPMTEEEALAHEQFMREVIRDPENNALYEP